jgi:hypothetical protein
MVELNFCYSKYLSLSAQALKLADSDASTLDRESSISLSCSDYLSVSRYGTCT